MKKLKLKRQTVRVLTDLSSVIGGVVPTEGVCLTRANPCTWNECPSFQHCG